MGETTEGMGVYAPAYGTIQRAIEFVLFYVVMDLCVGFLVALLTEVPFGGAYVPPLQVGSAVTLWAMLALVVFFEGRRQVTANPVDAGDLAEMRPAERRLALAGGAVLVGGGIAVATWQTVARLTGDASVVLEAATDILVLATSSSSLVTKVVGILGTEFGVLLAFGAGIVLLGYGLDRVVIGLVREAQFRRNAAVDRTATVGQSSGD